MSATAVSAVQAEMLVSIRPARQNILNKATELHALVPESALHARFASGPSITRAQIRKLLYASEMSNVGLQLIPLTVHPTTPWAAVTQTMQTKSTSWKGSSPPSPPSGFPSPSREICSMSTGNDCTTDHQEQTRPDVP
ncbi:hypothetical protein JHN63_02405 [Streptomyces sp. MBT65]|uniref:Scr1 family TA system antitoxin-like transcriptional regulator n=1 Tax=Streptomyces sp. MBT65 TaxID=1488395 RepID=UPI00190D2A02|nr:Scr1 family TA system antitoxin-like transcriptional regulator [Streptomyces sp. MBT65]MBK3572693.1 hypothetical protein [Streptomyces sp. MBT65]